MGYEPKFKSDEVDALFDAYLTLQTRDECYRFFDDLMTIKEIQSIAQRWQVARMLKQGKTYQEIENETKASTATISRINKCMQYGANGYVIALDRIEENNKK